MYPLIVETRYKLESAEAAAMPAVDAEAHRLYLEEGEETARDYLTGYCVANANNVVAEWWDLADELVTNFDDGLVSGWPKPAEEWSNACFPSEEVIIIE